MTPTRVEIAALVGLGAARLLRRHVARRPEREAGVRQLRRRRVLAAQHLGQPEVEDLHEVTLDAVEEHDVVGLEIAMHDVRASAPR